MPMVPEPCVPDSTAAPHLDELLGKSRSLNNVKKDRGGANPFSKDTKEDASATDAGRKLHNGIVRVKLNLKESAEVRYCLYFV